MQPAEVSVSHHGFQGGSRIQLCRHCADELMISRFVPKLPFRPQDVLDGLIDETLEQCCTQCGTSDIDVFESGFLGCDSCLDSFGERIAERLLPEDQRIDHAILSNPYHVGYLPGWLSGLRAAFYQDRSEFETPMNPEPLIPASFSWFDYSGPADDVVLCSRATAIRSIQSIPLNRSLTRSETGGFLQGLAEAMDGESGLLDRHDAAVLHERFFIDDPDDTPEGSISSPQMEILLGGYEHLRCVGMTAGLQLAQLADAIICNVRRVEEVISVRARIDYGVINRSVMFLGEGVELSVFLHLWGLDSFHIIESALQEACPDGIRADILPGAIIRLKTTGCLGISIAKMKDLLEGCTVALVHYERKARADMLQQRADEWKSCLHDMVHRTVNQDRLSLAQAAQLISDVRTGVVAGFWPSVGRNELTRLAVCVQAAHIRRLYPEEQQAERARAALVRAGLSRIIKEENIDV